MTFWEFMGYRLINSTEGISILRQTISKKNNNKAERQ